MGRKTPFPVTRGTVGNKTPGMTLAEDPAMRDLSEVYEDMTDHERERTVEYLKDRGRGGTGKATGRPPHGSHPRCIFPIHTKGNFRATLPANRKCRMDIEKRKGER